MSRSTNQLKSPRFEGRSSIGSLLAEHIPDDEAKLLSNGRLTCLICTRRPVFDTIEVLANHRRGKQHLLQLSCYIMRKRETVRDTLRKMDSMDLGSSENSPGGTVKNFIPCGLGARSPNERGRRKTIEVPNFNREMPSLPLSSPVSLAEGAHKDIRILTRKYMTALPYRRPFRALVEQQRENYGQTAGNRNKIPEAKDSSNMNIPALPIINDSPNKPSLTVAVPTVSPTLSGWKKNKDGIFVKDPDAEFDTDEE